MLSYSHCCHCFLLSLLLLLSFCFSLLASVCFCSCPSCLLCSVCLTWSFDVVSCLLIFLWFFYRLKDMFLHKSSFLFDCCRYGLCFGTFFAFPNGRFRDCYGMLFWALRWAPVCFWLLHDCPRCSGLLLAASLLLAANLTSCWTDSNKHSSITWKKPEPQIWVIHFVKIKMNAKSWPQKHSFWIFPKSSEMICNMSKT